MPFDWREYLAVARFLGVQSGAGFSPEATHRAVISRSYYAAYGYALRYASDYLGFTPRRQLQDRTQDHGRLRVHLRQRRRALIASNLERLRDWRNVSDYDDDPPAFDFSDAIARAEYIINGLLPPSPPQAAGT